MVVVVLYKSESFVLCEVGMLHRLVVLFLFDFYLLSFLLKVYVCATGLSLGRAVMQSLNQTYTLSFFFFPCSNKYNVCAKLEL